MTVQAVHCELHIRDIHTRMPFRYGIASMTRVPHLLLCLDLETGTGCTRGLAAESLVPKWFTKDADTPYRDDIQDMLRVIRSALAHVQEAGPQPDPFHLWAAVYEAQNDARTAARDPALLRNLGTSLVERALLDAACRARGQTLAQILRADAFGFRGSFFDAALADMKPCHALPDRPLSTLKARHTIGLGDPLWEHQIMPEDRVHDGLPQSLEAVIRTYGVDYFKIKIGGQIEEDISRLHEIAAILTHLAGPCRFTLDGNEQYADFEAFLAFWEALASDAALQDFLQGLLFIEQPLHRDNAMQAAATRALRTWPDHPPVIVDESDGDIHGLDTALACGYQGTSHKNCKGIFKSVANVCRIGQLRQQDPARAHVMSGEDLTNVGPVALLQDLAVLASLGIAHAERNGHHYFTGLSMHEDLIQTRMMEQHDDIYHWHVWPGGKCAAVAIAEGRIRMDSAVQAPFGYGLEVDLGGFVPLDQWTPDLYV